ncbi:hypothetical protein E6H34_05730 [Candidatus Bathyarchaeota archaeon]|nr:MAG: hypothetical protein E6H34_05730 [Candidatus Bathyarchaeota archaeon]
MTIFPNLTLSSFGGKAAVGRVPIMAVPGFDFSMANSGSIVLTEGSSGSNSITVTLVSGQSKAVMLSCDSGLPAGASCSFNPASGSPTYSSQLTIITLPTTPLGDFTIVVGGTGGGQKHTTQFFLIVNSPGPVGGTRVPVDKLSLVAPFVGLAALVLGSIGVVAVYLSRRNSNRNLPAPIVT